MLSIVFLNFILITFTIVEGQQTPHSYAPLFTNCPSGSYIRQAGTVESGSQDLSQKETNYIQQRRNNIVPAAYGEYLQNVENALRGQSVRLPAYVGRILRGRRDLPHVSAAISGGGLRASFVGAGVLNALDGRNASAAQAGTGGLLQAFDYITGLSGGACLVMVTVLRTFLVVGSAKLIFFL